MEPLPIQHEHPWDVDPGTARKIQENLRGFVETEDRLGEVRHIAGVDVGFEKDKTITRAAIVILQWPELVPVETAVGRVPTQFPYIPGFLSFREIPAVLDAFRQLRKLPDLVLCDGQGIAHPRRFGLACHLGILLDLPSIGVAKSCLTGTFGKLPYRKSCEVLCFYSCGFSGSLYNISNTKQVSYIK